MKTALVTVVEGEIYEKFTEDLFASAFEYFRPTDKVIMLMLPGRSGWPAATMYRYHVLVENFPEADYIFLSDADMLFEGPVADEILPHRGVTATLHPGYVNRADLPYETRVGLWSSARGKRYYCGGFVGGTRFEMLSLAVRIREIIDHDVSSGHIPIWHDESALNAVLSTDPPEVTLSPAYCYPDDDTWYQTIWTSSYERKLVALDKTQAQRDARHA